MSQLSIMSILNLLSKQPEVFSTFDEAATAALSVLDIKPVQIFRPANKEGQKWADYRMLAKVNQNNRDAILSYLASNIKLNRSVGSMVGMAVADAVGAHLEFLPVCNGDGEIEPMAAFSLLSMEYSGKSNKFRLQPGQWTDDSSMGFCMADSLLAKSGQYDGSDIRTRFHLWWNFGYVNCFINDPTRSGSVGLGGNIAMSLDSCRAGEVPTPTFERQNEDAGIGSLMRLAPIPVCYHTDIDKARTHAASSSLTTHPGLLAAECCAFVAHVIVRAINREEGDDMREFLDQMVSEYISLINTKIESIEAEQEQETEQEPNEDGAAAAVSGGGGDRMNNKANRLNALQQVLRLLKSEESDESKERCWNWKSDSLEIHKTSTNRGRTYNGYPVLPGYFGSFCMDGLSMALWSLYHTTDFDHAVEKCVNLLGDADSTASIVGQVAGAFYGYSTINDEFIKNLEKWDSGDTALRGALLFAIGNGPANE